MRRYLKLYWMFNTYKIKQTVQNKTGLVLFLTGKLLRFCLFFMFVYNLLAHTKFLSGYTFNQTLIFFLTFNLIDTLAQVLFREVYWFRPQVISGELSGTLIKPYNPLLKVLLGGVDFLDMIMCIPYLVLLLFFISREPSYAFINIIMYAMLIINALLIAMAFHVVVLAASILTAIDDQVILIYRDMTRMGALPIDIYKEPLRSILTFVIPVGIMMSIPVKTLFGLISPGVVFASIAVSGILLVVSFRLWDHALKQYQSWGG